MYYEFPELKKNQNQIIVSTRQSGKTIAAVNELAEQALKNSDLHFDYFGQTRDRTVFAAKYFHEHIEPDIKSRIIESTLLSVRFDNGCILRFSVVSPCAICGWTINKAIIDTDMLFSKTDEDYNKNLMEFFCTLTVVMRTSSNFRGISIMLPNMKPILPMKHKYFVLNKGKDSLKLYRQGDFAWKLYQHNISNYYENEPKEIV